jgi:hypothetical protein
MGVVNRRQPRADVQELADSRLTRQVADGPAEKVPLRAGGADDAGEDLADLITGRAVGGEVVLAA